VIDLFVDGLDLGEMAFEGVDPAATGRPAYHLRSCSSSTFTATSIECSRAAGSNERPDAISN
jgi:hypothetical protein